MLASVLCPTRKADAIARLNARLAEIGKGLTPSPKVGRITLREGLQPVVADQQMNGRSSVAHTARRIRKHLLKDVRTPDDATGGFFHPDRLMTTVGTDDCTAYAASRLAQGASRASVNLELAIVKRAFRLAVRANTLASAPHVPMLALSNVRQGFFEVEQFERVRAALPPDLRGIVTLAYFTGWRVTSEILPLTWAQVDRTRHVLRLEVGSTKNRQGRTLPYGRLPELVQVIDNAWAAHEALRASDAICPFVFHRHGKPIKNFRGAWARACTTAGVPGKLLHDFRRTACRNLTRAGVPEKVAMGVTGHLTRSVFDRYDVVREADIRDALGKLEAAPVAAHEVGQVRAFSRQ